MSQQLLLTVNLFLGLVTIGIAALVIQVWMPIFLRQPPSRQKQFGPHEWLLVGITVGFSATIGDNLFWGVTWLSKLQNWPTSEWWFDHGPAANLIFLHAGKITAGMCHLEAARQAAVIQTEDLTIRATMVLLCSVAVFSMLLL